MHLTTLIEMIESGYGDRPLLGTGSDTVDGSQLASLVRTGSTRIPEGCTSVVYVGENHPLLPVALFTAAWRGLPFVPLNYRLEDERLHALLDRQAGAFVLADETTAWRLADRDAVVFDEWLDTLTGEATSEPATDDDDVAIVLYTSGTTSEPKAALLRHRHLMAYLLAAVEFGSADETECALIAVPPYHIAGMANLMSNLFAGRRLVYLRAFDAQRWLETVRAERVTNAMVVPTMLARLVEVLDGAPAETPTLRLLSYGGAKVSGRVLRDALKCFPDTGFVNAYGLTETASTIAVLGPEDHRAALSSSDPAVARRLSSAGRILPGVEIEIRDDDGSPVAPGDTGMIFVRGDQIAGEYATGSLLSPDGWFCTRDRGHLDDEGYLFIEGRSDDTIIRGGENIAPAEIEEVLHSHPDVSQSCVVGVPDDVWGERIVAVVVPQRGAVVDGEALKEHVRQRLRGSKTPSEIVVRESLPHTDTGKLLRRLVADDLAHLARTQEEN